MISALLLTACAQNQQPKIDQQLVVVNKYAMPISNQLHYPEEWSKFREKITEQLSPQLSQLLNDVDSQKIKLANTNQMEIVLIDLQTLVFSLNDPPRPIQEAHQAAQTFLTDLKQFKAADSCPELIASLQSIIDISAPLRERSNIPDQDLIYCAQLIGFELNYLGNYLTQQRLTPSAKMLKLDKALIALFKDLPQHKNIPALQEQIPQIQAMLREVQAEEQYPGICMLSLQQALERAQKNLELCSQGNGAKPQPDSSPSQDSSPAAADSKAPAQTAADLPDVQIPEGQKISLPSGLKYTKIKEGQGQPCKAGDTVTVHYKGTLNDGTVFDSSYERQEPFEFSLGKGMVIEGWEQGVAGMKPGEKRHLVIPPDLAYGDKGSGPVPPNATLNFDVELLSIK